MNEWINLLQSIKYNAALAMTDAIWEANNERIYQELGLECLQTDVSGKGCAYFIN